MKGAEEAVCWTSFLLADLKGKQSSMSENRRFPLSSYLEVWSRRRRLVMWFVGVVVFLALVLALISPVTYKARGSLLPQTESGGLSPLLSIFPDILSSLGNVGAGSRYARSSQNLFVALLESRKLARIVSEELDIAGKYYGEVKDRKWANELAARWVRGSTKVSLLRSGVIDVEARGRSPQEAADMVNAYIRMLDKLNRETSFTNAKQTRRFIEKQLAAAESSLAQAQVKLQKFQEEKRIVSLEEQAGASVQAIADLQAKIVMMEATAEAQREAYTASYSGVRELEARIEAMKRKVAQLMGRDSLATRGENVGVVQSEEGVLIPLSEIPSVTSQLGWLMLEVETQKSLVKLLSQQLEQAKVAEASDAPTIHVIDWADPPYSKYSPKRKRIMMLGLLLGIVGGLFLALAVDYVDSTLPREERERLLRPLENDMGRWMGAAASSWRWVKDLGGRLSRQGRSAGTGKSKDPAE